MRVFAFTLAFTAFLGALTSEVDNTDQLANEPDLLITAHFPEENPFHHVVNGEKNNLFLIVENKSELNTTLKTVSGSFHDSGSNALVKNLSTMSIPVLSVAGSKFSIPFSFHSELKPGDYNLHVWVDHTMEETVYRVTAYDGIVRVVEPESSIFDFKMVTTYLVTALIVAAGGYFAVLSFFPSLSKPKRKRGPRPSEAEITSPVGSVKASGAGYQEEWIPEHHLKKNTTRRGQKKANDGVVSSGDEKAATSGAESTEGVRKSKRGKKA
ncbi:hypothetical protein K439DRAFT_1402735 [Ramaria rubella]|nr:hypothetical protein K439DRAFT_1402735 [Ramaria rubella]